MPTDRTSGVRPADPGAARDVGRGAAHGVGSQPMPVALARHGNAAGRDSRRRGTDGTDRAGPRPFAAARAATLSWAAAPRSEHPHCRARSLSGTIACPPGASETGAHGQQDALDSPPAPPSFRTFHALAGSDRRRCSHRHPGAGPVRPGAVRSPSPTSGWTDSPPHADPALRAQCRFRPWPDASRRRSRLTEGRLRRRHGRNPPLALSRPTLLPAPRCAAECR